MGSDLTKSLDTEFLASSMNKVRKNYYIDDARIAVLGFSDGGTYALSLATNNPHIFQAAMSWAAGFYRHNPELSPPYVRKPRILHAHGTKDDLFDLLRVAA